MGLIKNSTIKYGFACGQIKTLENQLLSKSRLERLIDTDNLKEQLKILSETDYGSYLSDLDNIDAIEENLEKYLIDFYLSITKMTNNPYISNFFKAKRDYHNIKIALKEKVSQKSFKHAYKKAGTIKAEVIERAVSSGDYSKISDFEYCIRSTLKKYEEDNSFLQIENEVDKFYFDTLKDVSSKLKNKFITSIVKQMIDLVNIKTCLRFKKWNMDSSLLYLAIINGGVVKKAIVIKLYMQNFNSLIAFYSQKGYSSLLENALRGEEINLEDIDLSIDNHIIEQVKESHYISVGIEPVIAYIFAKEFEVKSLRMVFLGTYNNLKSVEIVKHLRELYA